MNLNVEYIMYLRKSRADNENESVEQVLLKHETQLQEFCFKEFGDTIPERNIYREVVSGETIEDRPVVKEVLKRIESKKVKGVVVIEPQRLSRGDLVDCGSIVNSFRYSNTLIVTPVMTYDLNNKMERKFFEQELMRGNDYLEYVKEILIRGRTASVKKGNFIGSVAPYGYRKIERKDENGSFPTLEIVPEEAAAIRMMYDLYVNKNYGFRKIANALDEIGIKPRHSTYWSPPAIRDMLSNPVYIGKIRWNWRQTIKSMHNGTLSKSRPKSDEKNWILVDGRHEAIITEDLYQRARLKQGRNTRVTGEKSLVNPFSGLIFCECGKAMIYRQFVKKGVVASSPRLMCGNQTHCQNKSCLYSEMIDFVSDSLANCIEDFHIKLEEQRSNPIDTRKDILDSLYAELKKIDELDDEQHDLLESKIYTRDVFLKRNSKLMERKEHVKKSITDIEASSPVFVDYENKISLFQATYDYLQDPDADPTELNSLLKQCIERIEYSRHVGRYDHTPFIAKITFKT